MKDLKSYIEKQLPDLLESAEHFVVEVRVAAGKPERITIILDGDKGVSIDDCSKLSRKLGRQLEESSDFLGPYVLDVSSPGLDTPLQLERQYTKSLGRTVKVKHGDLVTIGELLIVSENHLTLKVSDDKKKKETKEVNIPRDEIKSTKVQVSFK